MSCERVPFSTEGLASDRWDATTHNIINDAARAYGILSSYTFKGNNGLLAKSVNKTGNYKITRSFRYPGDAPISNVENTMIDRNMIGIVIGDTVNMGAKVIRRALMAQSGHTFRHRQVFTKRGSKEFGGAVYTWDSKGCLINVADSAGVSTAYEYDSTGRYPVKMQVGGLESNAEWIAGVGVASLTEPDGVKSTYSYDTAGRLISSGIDGVGALKYWSYNISQTEPSSITEYTIQNVSSLLGAPV